MKIGKRKQHHQTRSNRRNDLTVAIFVSVLTLTLGVSQGAIRIPPFYTSSLLGVIESDFAIPILVIYDPPGDGSYTSLENHSTIPLTISLDTQNSSEALEVDAKLMTMTVFNASTSKYSEHNNILLCQAFWQRWELWEETTPQGAYTRLVLAESNTTGSVEAYSFEDLPDGIFVKNRSGTYGSYRSYRHIPYDSHDGETLHVYSEDYTSIDAGILLKMENRSFALVVNVMVPLNASIDITCHYYDPTQNLEFFLNSNSGFSQGQYINDLTIWFS